MLRCPQSLLPSATQQLSTPRWFGTTLPTTNALYWCQQTELGPSALPSSVVEHLDNLPWTAMGLGSTGSTGSIRTKVPEAGPSPGQHCWDECSVGINALLHGTTVPGPEDNRKCDHTSHFAIHIQQSQLKSGLHVVSEVVSVWSDILLTWFVFSCGFKHQPHKCSCLYRVFFIWEEWQQGPPQLTSWVWTSSRTTLKKLHLFLGYEHLFWAFQLSSLHVNHNPDLVGCRRRDYQLLVSWPYLASLPKVPGCTRAADTSHLTLSETTRQPCSSESSSLHSWAPSRGSEMIALTQLAHGLGAEAGAGESPFW